MRHQQKYAIKSMTAWLFRTLFLQQTAEGRGKEGDAERDHASPGSVKGLPGMGDQGIGRSLLACDDDDGGGDADDDDGDIGASGGPRDACLTMLCNMMRSGDGSAAARAAAGDGLHRRLCLPDNMRLALRFKPTTTGARSGSSAASSGSGLRVLR